LIIKTSRGKFSVMRPEEDAEHFLPAHAHLHVSQATEEEGAQVSLLSARCALRALWVMRARLLSSLAFECARTASEVATSSSSWSGLLVDSHTTAPDSESTPPESALPFSLALFSLSLFLAWLSTAAHTLASPIYQTPPRRAAAKDMIESIFVFTSTSIEEARATKRFSTSSHLWKWDAIGC